MISKLLKRKSPVSKAVEGTVIKIKLSQQVTPTSSKKELGRRILTELNPLCRETIGLDLPQVLVATPESGVQKKKTKQEVKERTS